MRQIILILVSLIFFAQSEQINSFERTYFKNKQDNILWSSIENNLLNRNYAEVKKLLEDAISKDIPISYFGLASLYKNGWGVEADKEKEKELYFITINHPKSDPKYVSAALYELAKIASNESNFSKAIEYYENVILLTEADNFISSRASFELAMMYYNGIGVEPDVPVAQKLFTNSYNYDPNVEASYMLGKIYYNQEKFDLAKEHFTRAAIAGNAEAQYFIGYIYANGLDGKADKSLADKYFKAACKKNIDRACLQIEQNKE